MLGVGTRLLAGGYARNLSLSRVLVVSDAGVDEAGWTDEVVGSLEEQGIGVTLFTDVTPNPRIDEVARGSDRFLEALEGRIDPDGLVAVGGGSPIDCAKGIGIVAVNESGVADFEGVDEIPLPMPPLICVPTTAGTGADVSQFAVFSDPERRRKLTVVSKAAVPDVTLIDAETTTTMDPYLTACTGLDALTHAIEAYVSNASSHLSDLLALESVRLIATELVGVLAAPTDLVRREQMMRASLYAGLAFSSASLGAVHAMAHAIGGELDLAHGECNAVLLEHVIRFNFGSVPDRYRQLATAMGVATDGVSDDDIEPALVGAVRDLRLRAGVDRGLGDLGVTADHAADLAAKAVADACMVTNPRPAGVDDVGNLYVDAL